jgi:hypothetical protein
MSFHDKFMREVETAMDREVRPRRTLAERLIGWITDTPIHAEEREYWLQMARRAKLATDIQERRLALRTKMKTVAVWGYECYLDDEKRTDLRVMLHLLENSLGERSITVDHVMQVGEFQTISRDFSNEAALEFARTTAFYQQAVLPWIEHQLDTNRLCDIAIEQADWFTVGGKRIKGPKKKKNGPSSANDDVPCSGNSSLVL